MQLIRDNLSLWTNDVKGYFWLFGEQMFNKPGTAEVGALSKAQKAQSFQNCKRRGAFWVF